MAQGLGPLPPLSQILLKNKSYKFFFLNFFNSKGRVSLKEKREEGRGVKKGESERERDNLPSSDSLPQWLQRRKLGQLEARSFFQTGTKAQELEISPTAFLGHQQEATSELEQPGLGPMPTWDAGTTEA